MRHYGVMLTGHTDTMQTPTTPKMGGAGSG